MKRLLVLGAGLVSPPFIRYFLPRNDVHIVVASLDFSGVKQIAEGRVDRIALVRTDIHDENAVRKLVRDADAVVSLLPAPLLPAISRIAVDERRHLVSTSYVTDAVRAIDRDARDADVLLLNETGLDPGIDHMTAIRLVRGLQTRGGTVTRFMSSAAGLPAPEANDNPWQYKFSWSPRGVITAARRDARFLRGGDVVEVPGAELVRHVEAYRIDGVGELEIYPNRDALTYRELYGLESATDLFRGTLRYRGWLETLDGAAKLGWLDESVRTWPAGTTYRDVSGQDITGVDDEVLERLRWAGFFSEELIGTTTASPLDLFVARLQMVLRYGPRERDMALLQHRIEASFPDGGHEIVDATLVEFGDPDGDRAMSRLVGLPAAIAANLILHGRVTARGVQIPVLPELYDPILDELEEEGVKLEERSS